MTTPITYYGGKQNLADRIISMIPPHKIYVEPFFWGGAVFFRKKKSYLEVINDINHMLINFYRVCQSNDFYQLKDMIDDTFHAEIFQRHAYSIYKGETPASDIEKAWSIWVLTNFSFSAKIGGGWNFCNGVSGTHRGRVIRHKRDDFSVKIKDRLKDVQISCRNAITVIKQRNTKETFFYFDPPYPGSDQGHYSGFTFNDFEELLKEVESIKGKFILSNFWSDMLQEYIDRNKWFSIGFDLPLNVSNKVYSNRKTELLVFNFQEQQGKLF